MPQLKRSVTFPDVIVFSLGALLLGLVFWRFATDPMWAIISFVLVFDPDVQAAKKAGLSRLALTIFGSALSMGLVFLFGLQKWLLPVGLAICALICWIFVKTRAGWRVVLVTVALIVGSALLQPSLGPYIAVTRSIEVTAGSLLAILMAYLMGRFRHAGARDVG